jgi:hypothetical protein
MSKDLIKELLKNKKFKQLLRKYQISLCVSMFRNIIHFHSRTATPIKVKEIQFQQQTLHFNTYHKKKWALREKYAGQIQNSELQTNLQPNFNFYLTKTNQLFK